MKFRGNGTEIHYDLTGPDDADVVTLSHALLADMSMWDSQLDALASFRVLRYDLRGHGQSTAEVESCDLGVLADDLRALLDELQVDSTHFVGSSLGGMIGLELATSTPDRLASLTLCDTRGHCTKTRQAARAATIETAQRDGVAALVQPVLESWFSDSFRKQAGAAIDKAAKSIESTSVSGLLGGVQAIESQNHTSRLGDIKIPCLIIVGEHDPTTPINEAFDLHVGIDGSDMVVMPTARHLANVESADEFNDVLLKFLNQYS